MSRIAVDGQAAHHVIVAVQDARELGVHTVAQGQETIGAPHAAAACRNACCAGVDVVRQGVGGCEIQSDKLQLVRVVNSGVVFAIQEGPGGSFEHDPLFDAVGIGCHPDARAEGGLRPGAQVTVDRMR